MRRKRPKVRLRPERHFVPDDPQAIVADRRDRRRLRKQAAAAMSPPRPRRLPPFPKKFYAPIVLTHD